MKAQVAVATVDGKAYYQIVAELRTRNIPFLSFIPGEPIAAAIQVVITTKEEQHLINHPKILIYDPAVEPDIIGNKIVRILQGKETYQNLTIGVDPGEVFGFAVLVDGTLIEKENCFSIKETIKKIKNTLKTVDGSASKVTIKIGSGVPVYKELIENLDEELPPEISIEIVSEAGTNRAEGIHGREFRHIISAVRIAGREGYTYRRRETNEKDN